VAIAGSPTDCAEAIAALGRSGASSIVVDPVGSDTEGQLLRFVEDVVPLVLGDGLAS
jgi:alkanesulfonate monooxygenase SsuD/methylene tetrahydromethanopterin reductase-like flavin-dependent oxidoreductase (luciferase family)